jgi:hypothetical protein
MTALKAHHKITEGEQLEKGETIGGGNVVDVAMNRGLTDLDLMYTARSGHGQCADLPVRRMLTSQLCFLNSSFPRTFQWHSVVVHL